MYHHFLYSWNKSSMQTSFCTMPVCFPGTMPYVVTIGRWMVCLGEWAGRFGLRLYRSPLSRSMLRQRSLHRLFPKPVWFAGCVASKLPRKLFRAMLSRCQTWYGRLQSQRPFGCSLRVLARKGRNFFYILPVIAYNFNYFASLAYFIHRGILFS